MIKYFEGTVFNTDAQAVVNTINCIGVMNAGIALEFGLRYPNLLKEYVDKCKNKEIHIGEIYYYKENDITIINFPTKWHFKYPSQIEWIENGLKNFVATYKKYDFKSVAFPKLGTLNGKLEWTRVKFLMEKYLSNLDVEVYICLDEKKEAEGIEKSMLGIINNISIQRLKENVKFNEQQTNVFLQNKPFRRFWMIRELDGLGNKTYKALFDYCYEIATGKKEIVQLSFLDN